MAGTVPLTGLKQGTTKSTLLGAGTIHKGLVYSDSSWNFADSLSCATTNGNKFVYTEKIETLQVDGVAVRMEGLDIKNGEESYIEYTPIDLSDDVLKDAMRLKESTSPDSTMVAFETKGQIEPGDYIDNFAFVGVRGDGKPIIIIYERALCTSGLTTEHKDGAATAPTIRVDCVAKPGEDPRKLPIKIFYPKEV